MPNSIRSTLAESNAAKTECPSGHPYDEGNTYVRPSDGARLCRECTRARGREAYRRRVASRKQAPPTQPTGVRALGVGASAQNARKTHCIKGHPLDGDNLVSWARNRLCRECYRERDRIKARARRARARAAA